MYVSIDLAAKFSATCVLSASGEILDEFDSWRITDNEFLEKIVSLFGQNNLPLVLVCEDLPHGVGYATNVKNVCRLQGRIIEKMHKSGNIDRLLFLPPATWQRHYSIFRKGPKAATEKCLELGYMPPIDFTVLHGKERAAAHKVNTDYCDAYLIAKWSKDVYEENNTFDVATTSRYEVR